MFEAKELPKNPDSDLEVDVEKEEPNSGDSKFDALLRILNLWWGILFRALFISFLGIFSYIMADPPSIGDVPFSDLTLNNVFENLIAIIFPIFCFFWILNYPKQDTSMYKDSNPYEVWSGFGNLLILIVVAYLFYLYGWDYIIHR